MICAMVSWWVAVAAALCSGGVGAVVGGLIQRSGARRGQDLVRQSDVEQDAARRREEAMRTMRWAAELGVSADANEARLGVRVLRDLKDSPLLHPEDRALLAGMLRVVVEPSLPPPA